MHQKSRTPPPPRPPHLKLSLITTIFLRCPSLVPIVLGNHQRSMRALMEEVTALKTGQVIPPNLAVLSTQFRLSFFPAHVRQLL